MPPSRIRDSLHGFETTCQMPGGQPDVRKCPTLGTGNIRKCPAVARGGGGWALLELTDALYDELWDIPEHSGLNGTLKELAKALRRFAALPFDINKILSIWEQNISHLIRS